MPEAHEVEAAQGSGQGRVRVGFRGGVLLSSSGTATTIIILFVEAMIAVRLLSTEQYGTYVVLLAIVNFLVMAIDFGLSTAITQMVAASEADRRGAIIGTCLFFRLIAIAGVSALILLARSLAGRLGLEQDFWSYAVYIPIMLAVTSLDELLLATLQGLRAYWQMTSVQVMRSALRLVFTLTFLFVLKLGTLGLIYSWILSFAAAVVYEYLVLPRSERLAYRQALLPEILGFGWPLQVTRFLWLVLYRIDVLLLGSLAGPSAVAFYEVAGKIPDGFQRLSESYVAVYYPTVASLMAAGKRGQALALLQKSLRLISFGVALIALVAVLFSTQIVTLLFSPKYAESAPAFAVLMVAFQMTFLVNLMGYTLTAAGYPKRTLGENVTRTTVTIVGDLLLIPSFGFIGSAWAALAARYAGNPVVVWLLHRSGLPVSPGSYIKPTLLLLAFSGLFYWLGAPQLLVKVGFIAAFVGLSFLMGAISLDEMAVLLPDGMLRRLPLVKRPLPESQ